MEKYFIETKNKIAYKVTEEGVFDWDTNAQSFSRLSSRPIPKNLNFLHSYSKRAAVFCMQEKERMIHEREKKRFHAIIRQQEFSRQEGKNISYFFNKKLKLAFKQTTFGVARWNPIEKDFTSALTELENTALNPMVDAKSCSRDYAIRYMLSGGNIEEEAPIVASNLLEKQKKEWWDVGFMFFSILGWIGVGFFVFYKIFTPSFWSKPWYVYPAWLLVVPIKLLFVYAVGAFIGLFFMSIINLIVSIFTCEEVSTIRSHSGWHL